MSFAPVLSELLPCSISYLTCISRPTSLRSLEHMALDEAKSNAKDEGHRKTPMKSSLAAATTTMQATLEESRRSHLQPKLNIFFIIQLSKELSTSFQIVHFLLINSTEVKG
jgi:hypothetical protein